MFSFYSWVVSLQSSQRVRGPKSKESPLRDQATLPPTQEGVESAPAVHSRPHASGRGKGLYRRVSMFGTNHSVDLRTVRQRKRLLTQACTNCMVLRTGHESM